MGSGDNPTGEVSFTPHYHPLLIYRAQVCKQPDVLLALFLLSAQFTTAEKKRNYDYYERITTHDFLLSPSIFSIVASEIGYHDKAYDYFTSTVRLDLDDYNGNTKDGLHMACMAGSWLCVVYGFAGMRAANGVLSFAPYLPEAWQEYRFNVAYQEGSSTLSSTKRAPVINCGREPLVIFTSPRKKGFDYKVRIRFDRRRADYDGERSYF